MPVKIASNDREIINTKTIAFFPTLRIGGRIYVHPQLPFNPHRKIEAFSTGSPQRRNKAYAGSISQGKTTAAWF